MKKKKILLIALTENRYVRGVERYSIELIKELSKDPKLDITLLIGKHQTYFSHITNVERIFYKARNGKINRHFFLISKMKQLIEKGGFELVHYLNTYPILFKLDIPIIITIHDLAEYFVPEKYSFLQRLYRKAILKLSVRNLSKIITVSRFSKKTLENHFDINNVVSIYNGINHLSLEIKEEFDVMPNINRNYILYWGNQEKSKGIINTLHVFRKLKNKNSSLDLVLIGKEGNATNELRKLIQDFGIQESVKTLGYVDDNVLISYIKNASLILFPSKYEGFGFPALEALMYNNNVVVSNTTSLGEVCGGYCLQANPENVDDIFQKASSLLENPSSRKLKTTELITKYNWQNCAAETKDIYFNL